MNNDWQIVKQNNGVCGADNWEAARPELVAIRNDYRWTPACQRAFLEALAFSGSVTRAARDVAKSPRSAYDLRFRRDGAAFALGWEAAILVSRHALSDMLMDRAVNGYEEVSTKPDDSTILRGRFDNRLGMNLLGRLDRLAEAQAMNGRRSAQVGAIVHDFESFLDLIETGGTSAEAVVFCKARIDIMAAIEPRSDCELAPNSGADMVNTRLLDSPPEVAAERLSIWFDDNAIEWRTNFPKADDVRDDMIDQTGFFGDAGYHRSLTMSEETAHLSALRRERQPWIDAAAKARDAWLATTISA